MNVREFLSMSEQEASEVIGKLCSEDMKRSGILASISAAQFILESGYGKRELAQDCNNCFGMKTDLSNNTWSGSTWGGDFVSRETKEQDSNGKEYVVIATFRKYSTINDSIADHSAYLLGAKNGDKLRYDGIKGMTDYRAVAQLIKDGGYATDIRYVDKLCNIIERFNLTRFDKIENDIAYRVHVGIVETSSELQSIKELCDNNNIDYCIKVVVQTGAFINKENAINMVKKLKSMGINAHLLSESEVL